MNLFLYDNLMIWACVYLSLSPLLSVFFSISLSLYMCKSVRQLVARSALRRNKSYCCWGVGRQTPSRTHTACFRLALSFSLYTYNRTTRTPIPTHTHIRHCLLWATSGPVCVCVCECVCGSVLIYSLPWLTDPVADPEQDPDSDPEVVVSKP